MDFYKKYLKYKIKYSNLKLQYGGGAECKIVGLFGFGKEKPICDILKDKECSGNNIVLKLDHKKEMLSKKCVPSIEDSIKWFKTPVDVVKFDMLDYPNTAQLYTAEDYKKVKYTIQDVLENLLIIYASDPKKYEALYDKVKKCLELLDNTPKSVDTTTSEDTRLENKVILEDKKNFMKFIYNLIISNNEKKLSDDKYKELMNVLKLYFDLTDNLSKKPFIQTFLRYFAFETSFNLIYDSINKHLFEIKLAYLLSPNLFKWDPKLKKFHREVTETVNETVINFILEKLKILSIEEIKKLFKMFNINYLGFFYQYLKDRIKTITDINLLLDSKEAEYYSNFFDYFPEIAIKSVNDLNVNDIVLKFNSSVIPDKHRGIVKNILINKLKNLLEQQKYIEFYELLYQSKNILDKGEKQSLYGLITSKQNSSKYMVAILNKFNDTKDDTKDDIIRQFAILMVVAFMYGFVITEEIKNIISMLMNKLSLSEPDFYLHQYRQFAGTPKYYTMDEYKAFNSSIEKKGIQFSGIQQAEIAKIIPSYESPVVKPQVVSASKPRTRIR